MNIKLPVLHCKRCNHSWIPRKTEAKCCGRCKDPNWNKDRKYPKRSVRTYEGV